MGECSARPGDRDGVRACVRSAQRANRCLGATDAGRRARRRDTRGRGGRGECHRPSEPARRVKGDRRGRGLTGQERDAGWIRGERVIGCGRRRHRGRNRGRVDESPARACNRDRVRARIRPA